MNFAIKTYHHSSIWVAAILTGIIAVFYAKLIGLIQGFYFLHFKTNPLLTSALAPFFFLAATATVRRFGPHAKGSGIPQVLEAIETSRANQDQRGWTSPLVSIRTAVVKVASSCLGLLGGASVGREGPTIQIAASIFAFVGKKSAKFGSAIGAAPFLTAGAAAGVAAAFNTPLAGITFVIEEVIDGAFGSFRQMLMIAVIVSGITAQAIIGNYLYFGHPMVAKPDLKVVYEALLIGIAGGLLGGLFAKVLAYPAMTMLPKHWAMRAFICGTLCALCCYLTAGATSGSGYEVTSEALNASAPGPYAIAFPFLKMITTVLSYLSGMAGGIFSPSLSIGSGLGIAIAEIFHLSNFRTCALIGMVAFFSGVIQAPFTAVIIVTEMTDEHILILPFMVAGFIGQTLGRKIMPAPLYHFLAKRKDEA
ncbi:MAG: chloride channel protein [Bacteriovoracia bacterium]